MLEALIVNFTNSSDGGFNYSDGIAIAAVLVSMAAFFYSIWAAKTANAIALLDVRAKIAMELDDFVMLLEIGRVTKEDGVMICPFNVSAINDDTIKITTCWAMVRDFRKRSFKSKYIFDVEVAKRVEGYHGLIHIYLVELECANRDFKIYKVISKSIVEKLDDLYYDLIREGKAIRDLIDKEARVVIKSPFDTDFNP
ncbi:hypothetical protein ABHF33_09450 [Chitinibacter sp. FCG-7]|uniref:DUF4760 domain-containing protein n=1 Tax=Chitinibacter mangrovi TaxID=3153927 RepID=A0AAU7F603_9NEIS